MITERIRILLEKKIATYPPLAQRMYREGIEAILGEIEKLETQARIEAWKEGWASAVEFGSELYFGEGDAKSFLKARDELLEQAKERPELILALMPSILNHIKQEK